MAETFSPTGRMLVARGLYRRWLTRYFSTITLAGLAPDDEPILLRKIYVPLVLTPKRIDDYAPEGSIHENGKEIAHWLSGTAESNVLLIAGEAGSGKTTLISALTDSLAGDVGGALNRRFEGYVPFPIRLREAPLGRLGSLSELVDWWLAEAHRETPELEVADVRAFLDAGRGILLLDGLDEVGALESRARVMHWLRNHPWVVDTSKKLSDQNAHPNLALVTGRPSGFEGLPLAVQVHVAPFSKKQIRAYLSRWFELRTLRSSQRQETVETLVDRLTSPDQSERLLPLARRPAYLASLAFVHGTRGELPYTRAALYELLVDAYIEMLDRQRGLLDRAEKEKELPAWDRQEKIEVLSAVAIQAHTGAGDPSGQPRDRRILWTRTELENTVRVAVGAVRLRTILPEHVPQLTNYFVARTGLLVEAREGLYQFGHLSFQEYLSALFILNQAAAAADKAAALESLLFPRLGEPGWLEVGVLVLAIDSNRTGGKGHEPVLARLDLNRSEQLTFLALLLSGEEIRFTAEERRAWIFVWLGFWATRKGQEDFTAMLRFPANRQALTEAWQAACERLPRAASPVMILGGLVEVGAQALSSSEDGVNLLLPAGNSPRAGSSPAPRQAWARLPEESASARDLTAARLLVIPQLDGFQPDKSEEFLFPVVERAELAFQAREPGRLDAGWLWWSLDCWALQSAAVLERLAQQTPLLWWLLDELFGSRVLRQVNKRPGCLGWRLSLLQQTRDAEQCWQVGIISFCAGSPRMKDLAGALGPALRRSQARERARAQAQARERAQAWERERAPVLARAREWARERSQVRAQVRDRHLAQDQNLAQDRDLDLARSRVLDRARERARDRARDLDLARTRAQDLDLDLNRAQDLELDRDLDRARDMARSLDLDLDRARGHLSRALSMGSSFKTLTIQKEALQLASAAIQAELLGASCLAVRPPFRRPMVLRMLEAFRSPGIIARELQGTDAYKQAVQEWQDVLASPLSPVPLLEDTLSREWEELPSDPEEIGRLFDQALDRLVRQLP